MRDWWFLVVLIIVACFGAVHARKAGPRAEPSPIPCIFYDKKSDYTFDFNYMRRSEDYTGTDDNGYFYTLNFCQQSQNHPLCSKDAGGSACQFIKETMELEAMLASATELPFPEYQLLDPKDSTKGVRMTFTNGDATCVNPRVLHVDITCGGSTGTFDIYESPNKTCTYYASMQHSVACVYPPDNDDIGLSAGWIFVIVVIVMAAIYVASGCVYNMAAKRSRGVDACPHLSFWRDLPALVKDGCAFVGARVCGRRTGNANRWSGFDDNGFDRI